MREDLGTLSDDETILLGEMRQGDDVAAARLVYRDWLEEHGDERAEVLRLEQAIAASRPGEAEQAALRGELRRLHQRLRHQWRTWLMQVSQAKVENCHGPPRRRRRQEDAGGERVEFEYVCPKTWDGLQATHDDSVRYCGTCQQHVFFCDTVDDANDLAAVGHCVAIDAAQVRHDGDFQEGVAFLGMVRVPTRVTNFYDEAKQTEGKPVRRRRSR